MMTQQEMKSIGSFTFVQVSKVDAVPGLTGLGQPMTAFVFVPGAPEFSVSGFQSAESPVVGEEKESNRQCGRRKVKHERFLGIMP